MSADCGQHSPITKHLQDYKSANITSEKLSICLLKEDYLNLKVTSPLLTQYEGDVTLELLLDKEGRSTQ